MISKTTHGADFRGVLNYLLDPAKRPTMIAPYMLGQTVDELTREFEAIANLRPTTRLPVRHISLSFAPEDGVIEDLDKETIVVRLLAEMGYKDCQFIGIAHHRDDPGHDQAHHHDHLHIVVNAIDVHGERISDSHERFRIQPILREIERDFGLQQVANSWDVRREKAQKFIPETELSVLIERSLDGCPDLQCWLERLAQSDVAVKFTLRKDGAVRGITFIKDGEAVKGSELGQSWVKIDRQLATTLTDLYLMEAANVRSQEHQVGLSEVEQRQFERAAVMAAAALDGKTHLKTGRVEIRREGQTMTVYRMRPHKQTFRATQTDRGWEAVGYPNIDAKDLDLLSKFAGMSQVVEPIRAEIGAKVSRPKVPSGNVVDHMNLIRQTVTERVEKISAVSAASEHPSMVEQSASVVLAEITPELRGTAGSLQIAEDEPARKAGESQQPRAISQQRKHRERGGH